MLTKVQMWGNSLGVRIPKSLADDAQVQAGSQVDLAIEHGRLVITPVAAPRYELADLLARITPENLHEEFDFGSPQGREVW
jgi:antitoxin MazE